MTAPYFPSSLYSRARSRVPSGSGVRRRHMSEDDLLFQQEDLIRNAGAEGDAASRRYADWAGGFDASDALNTYARGAFGSVSEGLKAQLAKLGGSAVGQGRFDSGFFDEDQGEVVRNVMGDFTNNLSQQAMNAAQLQASVKSGLGEYGARRQSDATDLLMSRREEVVNDRREAEERKRSKRRGIGGAIGGILGAGIGGALGGPAGAAVGWRAGGGIAGAF